MKIVIIYPEVLDIARYKEKRKEFPPFGALYLAAVIEEISLHPKILNVSPNIKSLDLREFDIVVFTIPSSATYGIIKQIRFESQYSKNAMVLVGGVHPTFYPEETLYDLKPDVVGIGEGEETIIELIQAFHTRVFQNIEGICYFVNGKATRTKPRSINRDIDWLPLPARHLLNKDDFIMSNRLSNTDLRMAHVMFTRGCPFLCRFCAAARTRVQFRSGLSARKELIYLKEQYNIDGFAIVDDNFIVNKKKVIEICESIQDLGLKWSALSRIDTVDQELLEVMYKSGCIEIKYGIETASYELLKSMDKNITLEKTIQTLKMTNKIGIKVKAFMIHGYPGENEQTTQETIEFINNYGYLIERVTLFRFVPLPGTYVYQNPQLFDLKNTDKSENWDGDWSKYHIHHNNIHWWGSKKDFETVNKSYKRLKKVVIDKWGE